VLEGLGVFGLMPLEVLQRNPMLYLKLEAGPNEGMEGLDGMGWGNSTAALQSG
jgi:hypothetical protein